MELGNARRVLHDVAGSFSLDSRSAYLFMHQLCTETSMDTNHLLQGDFFNYISSKITVS